jgi:hypothetical protein
MFVDTAMLHSGATESHRAGSYVDDGAHQLTGVFPVTGMFGDFEAAHTFHGAVTEAHTHHVAKLRAHQEILSGIGDKARTVAAGFSGMEERNASELQAVRCNYKT